MAKEKKTPQQFSADPAAQQMLIRAEALGIGTAFTRAEAMPACNIGSAGMCCKWVSVSDAMLQLITQ